MNFEAFLQNLSNGISLGSLYALIAIGYTMVYGILRLINFAHGDLVMLGSYVAFYGVAMFMLPWWLAFPLAILVTAGVGIVIERSAYKPLRDFPRINLFTAAVAVSFLLENLGIVIFGGRPKAFERPAFMDQMLNLGGVSIVSYTPIIIITALVLFGLLLLVIYRTKAGMAMRALSKDIEATGLMGVNTDKIIMFAFMLGSALAAAGGILWAIKFPQINPLMGVMPGLKAFIAAVLGGIGNVGGAMIGGFLLGIVEIMIVAFFPELSGYRDAFAYAILILLLLFRPTGIMGEVQAEKV
ncbi:MAG TPA: branched-chain amino acid ABC transporter permease [Anaerolineaceae bacterium]|jgi:branched-chain amino acid transport system permease protein|nr:branched-chain amino acid ABC transporter permease [Anaerolineaceae bacterium]NMD31117.1 branched-chain amino acid ABC transporter permease [Chloroflexota bacterium]HNZ02131.1 branched-chain amino acid ABC transporter permease [Anaerolineaceae bacterium]HOH21390.1 branched-chain amino acid ABC transporter permease [Anaerolineaceae bacterium]HOU45337.1 branched-chain amino acid ABC transporter permease [Anaerolineaceae bacterium]